MKCPNCQTENRPGAKFCVGCGAKLAVVQPAPMEEKTAVPSPAKVPVQQEDEERTVVVASATGANSFGAANNMNQKVCTCGAPLKPGAKFCSVCGKVISQISGISDVDDTVRPNVQPAKPVTPVQPAKPVTPAQPVKPVPPVNPTVPPVQPINPKKSVNTGKKKSNGPLIITLIILSIITILIVVFLGKVVLTMKDESCSFAEAIDVIFDGDSTYLG